MKKTILTGISSSLLFVLLIVTFVLSHGSVHAQDETPDGPIYIVQEGDSLWTIAIKFGVSIEELQNTNNLGTSNQLNVGDRLTIPGIEGVQGIITTRNVPLGESLRSISRRYQISEGGVTQLNRLTSPDQTFAGSFVTVPEQENGEPAANRSLLTYSLSLLELSVVNDVNPWTFVHTNDLVGTWQGLAGDVLFYPNDSDTEGAGEQPGALPEEISAIEIRPLSPLQGKAAVLNITAEEDLSFSGSFIGQEMNIFPNGNDGYTALLGVHAMKDPGLYPLTLEGERSDGTTFGFSQMVLISAVDYPYDRPLTVDPATIDPAVTKPENAQWIQLASTATPEKMWQDIFQLPSPLPIDFCLETGDCWSSRYGNRRSYNGGPYDSFHTGLDIVGKTGTEIYAPAPGVVVFAGPLTVRGNATMINHGWGVYSAYMHQDEILVQVGDYVETGQLIGLVGATGRVEGPHLHWEVWSGGVQVDPLDWLEQVYP